MTLIGFALSACGAKSSDVSGAPVTETAQQVGDVMSSVDEAGSLNGSIAFMEHSKKTFARLAPDELQENVVANFLLPQANAVTCDAGQGGYAACSGGGSGSTTRTFAGCTVGGSVTFTGTVTNTWSGTAVNCVLGAVNDAITRVPNFTVQGRRSAALVVSKSGAVGQRLTWASGTGASKVFNFSSDGINRKFTNSSGVVTFDHTTSVVNSTITITGTQRLNRTMTGGTLRVRDNIAKVNCDFVPTNLTWGSASCNCPTAGSWTATCTRDADSSTYTSTLVVSSVCGSATFTDSTGSNDVKFDRCGT